jgi:hypothetical protein
MNFFKLAFIFLALATIGCWSYELEAVEILSKKSDGANITTVQGLDFSAGFTACFRVMFYFLNSNFVFNSPGTLIFQIKEYLPARGMVQVIGNLNSNLMIIQTKFCTYYCSCLPGATQCGFFDT